MARYRVLQPTFIAPTLYKEGAIIDYDGAPGPHLLPMDQEAYDATDTYIRENPHALINPTEGLSRTVGGDAYDRPVAAVASQIGATVDPTPDFLGTMAQPAKLVGEGRIAEDLLREQNEARTKAALADAAAARESAATTAASEEAKKKANDEAAKLAAEKGPPPVARVAGDNPAFGDPTKPGEKGAETAADTAKANEDSVKKVTPVSDLKV